MGRGLIMTDFMDRDDQKMVNFYHRVARACADEKIMLMSMAPLTAGSAEHAACRKREGVLA